MSERAPTAADYAVAQELLRAQVVSCRAQLATKIRTCQRTEAALQQYLEALFPHLFPQALAQQLSVVEAAEYFYQQQLHGDDPLKLFGAAKKQAPLPAAPPTEPGVDLSGDAAKFLLAAGLTVVSTEIKVLWAQLARKAVSTAKNTVLPELLDKGLLRVEQIPVPRYLTGYASDTCYLLTAAGHAEYRRRFSDEAVTYDQIYGPHKSPEAWWQVRAVAGLIRAGNDLPPNTRFTYTVYDPTGDPETALPAGFARRYGNSEPDLIVVITAQTGGAEQRLALECERASYSAARLKEKLLKNLQNYGAAGFSGCYYVANNGDAARSLGGAMMKLRDELKENPEAVTARGFLALFTLEALKEAWLPTPPFIEAEFFDRKTHQVSAAWPPEAAKPERYLRWTPKAPAERTSEMDKETALEKSTGATQ